MFENSDDYDFAPSGSSKLASLFDGSILSKDTSSNLTYTAPKQPKAKKDAEPNESTKNKPQSSVVLAKVITLWKLEDPDYKSVGKHGLAIIGSVDLNLFEVISYKEKNNIILRRKINNNLNFYNQKDCFSSFYDNENQNWLVKFNSIDDQNEFCKEIKTRGANVVVNVDPSPSPALSRTVTKESIVKPDLFPRESAISKPEVLPKFSQTFEKDYEDANSDSSGSQKRAHILSRMAKMGQQILPNDIIKNASTDISDSELDDSKNEKIPPRKFKRAVPVEKHVPKEERLPQQPTQVIPTQNLNQPVQYPQQNMVNSYPQQNMLASYPQNVMGAFPPHMLSPVLVNQAMPYDSFQQYLVSQNTDLKLNLAQISAKLDTVLSVGSRGDIKTDDGNLKSKIKTLELRSENLLTELERYEKLHDDLQRKCKKLEQESAESESNKTVIEILNKQIEDLKQNLLRAEEKSSDCENLKTNLERCKNNVEECKKTIETQKLKIKHLEEFYEENKNLQGTVDTLNDTVTNLKLKLKDFEEHFLKTEAEKQKRIEEEEKTINAFSDKIKEHMNNMYQSILAGFQEGNSYSVTQIKSQVAQNLKGTTFAVIKEFKDVYKTEGASISNQ